MSGQFVPQTRTRLPPAVIALGFTSFFTDVGSEMIFPLLPVFVASLGAAPAFLGLVEGVAEATSSFLKLASGYAGDRVGAKKPLVLFGYTIAAVVRPLMAVATAPWHVLAVRVTDRIGKGIRTSPRDALLANSVRSEEAGRAFGFHRAMDHAGAVVGPLIATALLSLGWELRSVFWLALVPGALSLVCVTMVREPAVVAAVAPASSVAAVVSPLSPSYRRYLAILALFCLGSSSDAFLLLRASEVGVSIAMLPLLWTLFHVSKVISSALGGRWSDRYARVNVILAGWGIYAVTYLGFGLASEPWQVWMLFVIYGTYYGLTEPAEKALVKDLAPVNAQGRAFGMYNFVIGVCAIPAGLLTGFLWQTFGPSVALGVGSLIATVSSLALWLWHDAAV